ncbi:hypothetical protein LG3211_0063 [Lysobacter gummosus]|nr:hypothetical protein LG3211_0063 [Lysobacter gummosus]
MVWRSCSAGARPRRSPGGHRSDLPEVIAASAAATPCPNRAVE